MVLGLAQLWNVHQYYQVVHNYYLKHRLIITYNSMNFQKGKSTDKFQNNFTYVLWENNRISAFF